jgi:porin
LHTGATSRSGGCRTRILKRGANVFVRVSASPSNRNEIDFYIDGGVTLTGVVSRRPDDVFGVAFAYSQISSALSAFDRDEVLAGNRVVLRNAEALLDVTYQLRSSPAGSCSLTSSTSEILAGMRQSTTR